MVTLVKHDLEFILKQIRIAEAHAAGGDLAELVAQAGQAAGVNGTGAAQPHLLPYGLRTVDGTYNNLIEGQESWGAADKPFVSLVGPNYINEGDDTMGFGTPQNPVNLTNNDYTPGTPAGPMLGAGTVVDADPRIISNLIVDQTSNNPAAIMVYDAMLAEGKNATRTELLDANGVAVAHQADVLGPDGTVLAAAGSPVYIYNFENVSPDIGDSAPYNSMFTLFGQFFDHGLDLVAKGGAGTVYIPLQPGDPLYNPASPHTNFMALTRASRTADGEVAANVTTPWVDQNQTYTSHASHQVFLREYVMHEGKPVATGNLLNGDRGLATWADVKEQARTMLGIELTDADVANVPLLRTDPYGRFIPNAEGFAQVIVGIGADGVPNTADDIVVSGTPGAPVGTANAVRIGHAFLDDIAHSAVPVIANGALVADADEVAGNAVAVNTRGQNVEYDDELLDAHYITGDGRGNENIGLTSIHHVFHSEHNRIVEDTKQVVLESGDLAFLNEWLLEEVDALPASQTEIDALVWNGERLFQAGRFTTEMQYQHLVFEEFGRKMQPDIDAFLFEPSTDIDPAIFAEFAHAVYRFGHSMLNQNIDRLVENPDGSFSFDNITLFDGFLNPLELGALDEAGNVLVNHDQAAGAIIRGMSRQSGNEIDEFVTDVLRNQLVGIPLDLAALNIARGRDVGLPTLNQARAQFYQAAGQDTQLKPYVSWTDFALNLQNTPSIVNFIAAYGTHATITGATTLDEKRAAAAAIVLGTAGAPADRLDFLNSTGTWAATETGLNAIDLWIGGLAEKKMDFGGMLGSTFSFVFELQMENLQEADRFYYLSRVQGLNLLNELENNSLTEIIMRNTDIGAGSPALPGDIFSTPDHTLEMDQTKQVDADPIFADPILQALTPLVVRRDTDGDGDLDYLAYHGADHVVMGGTDEDDIIIAGEGDDTIWGYGGNDTLEAGYGVDRIHGGDGDDIITNAGTDIGAADFLHGEGGNDVIHGGSGLALIFGNEGKDFIIAGPDGKHVLGGLGDDFIRGGDGGDFLMGNEGNDWIEGGGRFDTLAGENSELFFNSSIIGHDVLNGDGSDTDYDAESGDDIMFQGNGIQRSNGMAGFDWAIHKGDQTAANSDLGIPLFATQEAFILRDRFDLVEGLSGWIHDDVLTGRIAPTNARAELQNTAAIPADGSPLESYSNALLEKNLSLINGLAELVAHLARTAVTVNGVTEQVVMDTADASDILLGGGGSDRITGLAGDDIIDGDRWLNVRIRITDAGGNEIGSADGLTKIVYAADGSKPFGDRTLSDLMFDRTLNPSQLEIVREIIDGNEEGDVDVAVYTDVRANYTVTRNADGSVTVDHTGFDPDGGPDGDEETVPNPVSDGTDRLFNIERLRFADGEFALSPPQLLLYTVDRGQYRDDFSPSNYTGSDGTTPWTSSWIESSDTGGATGGDVLVTEGQLRFDENGNGASIQRSLNLAGATTARISYTVAESGLDQGDTVTVWFSANGTTFTQIDTINAATNSATRSFDLTGPFSASAVVRFTSTALGNNDIVDIDNVAVEFTRPAAAPSVNYATSFVENGTPVAIASGPVVTDEDGGLVSARIVLTNAQNGDELAVGALPAGITATTDLSVAGQIAVILTGAATLAAYQAAIQAISFANSSDQPGTTPRVITVTVNDGLMDSDPATATIAVTAVNDAPVAGDDAIITNVATGSFTVPEWALLANDTDVDSVLNITGVTENGTNFTAVAGPTGDVTITHSTTQQRSFTYTVSDGSATDTATVSVTRDTNDVAGTTGNNILIGDNSGSSFDGGTGNDIVLAGGGNDTIIWNANNAGATDGRDIVDGGAGTDTFDLNGRGGQGGAETFRIYTRQAAIDAGITGLQLATEIVITRNGTDNASVIAELDNIEEITVGAITLDDGTPTGGTTGGDTITVIGDFSQTSLALNTITIDGSDGDDVIDISALSSAHRIVFRSNGGNDTIIGTLRPQDVIELPDGTVPADYETTTDDDGRTTMSNGSSSISFVSTDGHTPNFGSDDEHEEEENDDDEPADDDDDCGTGNEAEEDEEPDTGSGPSAPATPRTLIGTVNGEALLGAAAADMILAGDGADIVAGEVGADILRGEGGDDLIAGGAGADIAVGGDGDDEIHGGAEGDFIFGDAGADRLYGDDGGDVIEGGAGDDQVWAGAGDDLVLARANDGSDSYWGGEGADTLDYAAATGNLTVDLGNGFMGRGSVTGGNTGTDTVYGFENFIGGSGQDTIIASAAVNVMDGGLGDDVFRFNSAAAANGDKIYGFQPGDKIDFSAIDADTATTGIQGFALKTGAITATGQIAVSHELVDGEAVTVLRGNLDSDPEADFELMIAGTHNLKAADFNGVS